jgi:hypothetical protein
VAELSCPARTVSAWEVEVLAFHSTGSCSNAPIQAGNVLTGKVKPLGTASATSPTTTAAAAALRRQVTHSPHRKTARALPTLGGEEPLTKAKAGCWTRRRAFAQVRPSSNIQLLLYSLVSPVHWVLLVERLGSHQL